MCGKTCIRLLTQLKPAYHIDSKRLIHLGVSQLRLQKRFATARGYSNNNNILIIIIAGAEAAMSGPVLALTSRASIGDYLLPSTELSRRPSGLTP